MRKFLSQHPLEPQSVRLKGNEVTMEVFVSDQLRGELRRYKLKFETLLNATILGANQSSQVGKGNRFAGGKVPIGLGIKTRTQ